MLNYEILMIGSEVKVTPSAGLILRHKGKFDFKEICKKAKSWIDSKKYDFTEKENSFKDKSDMDETTMVWVAEREVDDYIKFVIETAFLVKNRDKRQKINFGEIKLNISAHMELGYNEGWKKSAVLNALFYLYNNFIIRKRINQYQGKLYGELTEYIGKIKKELEQYD
jgi:hypothetical protein